MYQNILYHIIKNENSMTDMLRALCVFKPFRDIVVKLFTNKDFNPEDVQFEDIETQFSLGNSRPDMIIRGNNVIIFVEVKISKNTKLTDNQPGSYLKELDNEKSKDKFLVFLIPPDYPCEEFEKRAKNSGETNIEIKKITWTTLRDEIEKSELSDVFIYARDFNNLIKVWYESLPIKFSLKEIQETKMFNKEAAECICKIFRSINEITSDIEQYCQDFPDFRINKKFQKNWWDDDGEYGIYINYKDKNILFGGLWTKFWKENGSPLCLAIQESPDHLITKYFKEKFGQSTFLNDGKGFKWWVKPIDEKYLSENAVRDVYNELLKDYLDGISEYLNKE